MNDHTVRGKFVRLRSAEVNVRQDGSVHLDLSNGSPIHISEQEALDLYRVLCDVIEYGPGDGTGTTEGSMNRETHDD